MQGRFSSLAADSAWRLAYGLALAALCAYTLSQYPRVATRYADLWSGGVRIGSMDNRLFKPAVVYAIEGSGEELRIRVWRTYAEPALQNALITVKVLDVNGKENVFIFRDALPPGRLATYTVYAPRAASLTVEIRVGSVEVVEKRWLGEH